MEWYAATWYGTNPTTPYLYIYRGTTSVALPMGAQLNDGKWHHVVFALTETTVKIYIDGIARNGTQSIGGSRNLIPNANFYMGRINLSGTQYFTDADIEELAIWSRVLSEPEIKQLFSKGAARIGTQYKVCDDSECNGESWSSITYPTNGLIDLTGTGDYFQFKNNFELLDLGSGQKMHNAYAVLEDVNIVYQN